MGMSTTMELRSNEPALMIGKTDTKIFWIILIVSLLVVTFVVEGISHGLIAVAANAPLPTTVTAKHLKGTKFKLIPGISSSDKSTPVAIGSMDATITDLQISKTFQLPVIGKVTLRIKAGTQAKHPAKLSNMLTDMSGLKAHKAAFAHLVMTNTQTIQQKATRVNMSDVTLQQQYLSANNVTLPDLTLTISVK